MTSPTQMSAGTLADLTPGSALPSLDFPPLSRTTLALYAGGSGDHNPLHIDTDFARERAGMPDVIGHGMLTMAYLGRYLTKFVPQRSLRKFGVRFQAVSHVGDAITCTGTIVKVSREEGRTWVELDVTAHRGSPDAEVLASGRAVAVL